jgi:hypothetical protein
VIFCDTSFAAKVYVPEAESASVLRLVEAEDEVCASDLMRVELMGVFHRRLRERLWSAEDFNAAVRQFSRDHSAGFWSWLPVDGAVVEAAAGCYASLPEAVFLRSADCVHLFTAIHHGFSAIHTFDRQQARAAEALGIKPSGI